MTSIHHTLRAAALAAAALFIGLGAQAQTVVTNTNFQPVAGWQQVAQNTSTTLGAYAPGSGWSSASTLSLGDVLGNQFLLIDGGESATFTFTGLTIGRIYDVNLAFDFAGFRNGATDTQVALRINTDFSANPRNVTENMLASCPDNNGCATTFSNNLTRVFWNGIPQFTANATTGSFTFNAFGGGNSRVALDDVRVAVTDVTPVPEPETYAMMLAGLGAIGFMSRRRKSKQA